MLPNCLKIQYSPCKSQWRRQTYFCAEMEFGGEKLSKYKKNAIEGLYKAFVQNEKFAPPKNLK